MRLPEEREYVDRAIRGDKQAFNVLADFYYAACFGKAKSILNDKTLAQDITQISLLQAYRNLDKLRTPSQFKFWLLGIVRNISHNYIRQKSQLFFPLDDFLKVHENSDEASSRISELLLSAIQSLDKPFRDVITAYYYDGLGQAEIALRQQLTLSTVKVRLHRGRQLLKQKLITHKDLFYYYRKPPTKTSMKKMTIADIYPRENGGAGLCLLLQTEEGAYFLPIIIGLFEAEGIFLGLQKLKNHRPWTHDLAASIITATNSKLEAISINKLIDGVFYAYLAVETNGRKLEIDARPSDAIALAVRFDAVIFVAEEVLEKAGVPIPEPYQQVSPLGKGINQFVRFFARNKVFRIVYESALQKQQKVDEKRFDEEAGNQQKKLVDLVFGEKDVPKLNFGGQPHRYATWTEALEEPDKVLWLDLKKQDLTDFAEKIKRLPKVKVLELTNYGLTEIPTGIDQISNLCQLNLSNNQLSHLLDTLDQLSQLEELNLSSNKFTELPTSVGRLPTLRKIDLSKNPSLHLPQVFEVLSQIESFVCLELQENNLISLPEEITRLRNLVTLSVGGNPRLDLPQLFQVLEKLPSLNMLEMKNLSIVSLPEEIFGLHRLSGLNLSDNSTLNLEILCQQFSHLENIKVLVLTRCCLSPLKDWTTL